MTIVKSEFRSLYLLSARTSGLRPLICVAADKSGFHPLTEKKFTDPNKLLSNLEKKMAKNSFILAFIRNFYTSAGNYEFFLM